MASCDDLQALYRHLREHGVASLRARENTFSRGIYCNDPDGNGNEAYYEDQEACRRGTWEGEYVRKLEEVTV